jgi:transcriptional regulator with XRE-family HTH domain
MSIGERFALVLKEKKVTQKSFAEKVGVTEQSITKLVKGQTQSPKADLIAQLTVMFPDVNLRWLLIGEGEMLKKGMSIADETQEALEQLQKENSQLKDKIIELLENK